MHLENTHVIDSSFVNSIKIVVDKIGVELAFYSVRNYSFVKCIQVEFSKRSDHNERVYFDEKPL